jgi:dTDP-4-dehydrorhamnose reductase
MAQHVVLEKIKIAVLGSNGQLGQEFKTIGPGYEFLHFDFYSRQSLDITDAVQIKKVLGNDNYNYVINCAAYTAVDKAEHDAEACKTLNTSACKYITDALTGCKTGLVHFSSDYVYHSYTGFPIKEVDKTDPSGIYARSKLAGEHIIRKSDVPSLILRTSWVVSSFGHNFVKTMIRLGAEKSTLNVVNDQYGAPTYARHLATAVLDIISAVISDPTLAPAFNDTYNYANEGIVTWYDIAALIMKEKGLACNVIPVNSSEFKTSAQRPHWSVMSKQKIKSKFGLDIPHWYTAIKECMTELS